MRALLTLSLILAACDGVIGGGGGGGGDDGSNDGDGGGSNNGDSGPVIDGPPPTATLPERLAVSTITTPAGVKAGVSNWRIWGRSSLRVAPVFTVPYADCGTLVGYTTGTAATPRARVARLNAQ